MDHLTAFVSVSHLKLRLEILSRYPHLLLEYSDMEIKAPIELAGLKARLARAKALEARSGVAGKRVDSALDTIDEAIGAVEKHAGQLEQYGSDLRATIEGMVAGSNGPPTSEDYIDLVPATEPEPTPLLNAAGGPRIL